MTVLTNPSVHDGQAIVHVPVVMIGRDVLPDHLPSCYCQSACLGRLASDHFGHLPHPLTQALAISYWIFENIDTVSGATSAGTPDFHADFEICVGNHWFVFEPTCLSGLRTDLLGLQLAATQRMPRSPQSFGAVQFDWMGVSCAADYFQPMIPEEMVGNAIILES